MPVNVDGNILVHLNSMIPANPMAAQAIASLGNNPLLRGFPVFFPLIALWFSGDCKRRRSRMLVGLLATTVATLLSVLLQDFLFIHSRPFLDPTLHLRTAGTLATLGWRHINSFPSDTSTLFFALSMVIFLEHRIVGFIVFLWTFLDVGVLRVATGWHYPSDIAGGLILGVAFVYSFSRIKPLEAAFDCALQRCKPRIYIVHALLFIFLADAFNLFAGLHGLAHGMLAIRAYLVGR